MRTKGAIATGPTGATETGLTGMTASLLVWSLSRAGTLARDGSSSRGALLLFCNTLGAAGAACCAGAETAKHCRANARRITGSFLVKGAMGARLSKGRAQSPA